MGTTNEPVGAGRPGTPRGRRKSVLWDGLNRGTGWLYGQIARSLPGRLLTSYRHVRVWDACGHRYAGRNRCSPMSEGRQSVVRAVEKSVLYRMICGLLRGLFMCPTACYGLFGLVFGLMGALAALIAGAVSESYTASLQHYLTLAGIVAVSLPLLSTGRPFAQTLYKSRLWRLILVNLLGIPEERMQDMHPEKYAIAYFPAYVFGLLAAVGSVFVSPLAILVGILLFGLAGMILSYPETGVVLISLTLPLVWLNQVFMALPVVLILVAWAGYGVKALFLHRPLRFGLLDRVMLVWLIVLAGGCLTAATVSMETLWLSLCLLVIFSVYFLFVNLMTSRAYIRRCLKGVAVSVGLVMAMACLRLVPVDSLSWLEGSRAGDAIVAGFQSGITKLSGLWAEHSELFLVLALPWLYAFMLHTKRFFGRIMGGLAICLGLTLIYMPRSISALFCVAGVTVLFLLLVDHAWLSAGIVALPLVGCGLYWGSYAYPLSDALQTILSRSRLYKSQLTDSLWAMCLDHPGGIGAGEQAFVSVYPAYAAPDLGAVTDSGNLFFEIVLSFGWPGVILAAAVFLLFLQKSMTCLQQITASSDRAMILGGITSLTGVIVFGTVRSFITAPRVFFTVILVIALCSAYENVVFDESDVLRARWVGASGQEDRFYCKGRNLFEKE